MIRNRFELHIAEYDTTTSVVSAANTNTDGSTGTYVTIATGTAGGSQVIQITAKATGTTTAGMLRLFFYDGTNARFYDEIDVTAVASPGASTQTFDYQLSPNNLVLSENDELRMSTHNAETFHVTVLQGNF